jgi:UDP-2-acetamido-2,6-beta-L-arabino-hexul-4-ose reductase
MTRKLAIVGAGGFIGKNLLLRASEQNGLETYAIARETPSELVFKWIDEADCVINLAGINRAANDGDLLEGNMGPIRLILDAVKKSGRSPQILHVSSSRAEDGTPYGKAKLATEQAFVTGAKSLGLKLCIFRPPNVFGKWCRPNYNSAVATFCHNIARDLPIKVNDPVAPLTLVYVDDFVDVLLQQSLRDTSDPYFQGPMQTYTTNVGELAAMISLFHQDRQQLRIAEVGTGLKRALYATYIANLPTENFSYPIKSHGDARGFFSEVLKTQAAGQFSYFNALLGVTRGGHYHHSKVEKFLVVHGEALFRFRHMLTGQQLEIRTSAAEPVVVETIPGWVHDVTNTGQDIMVSLLWANEVFDHNKPDTIKADI